MSKKPIKFLLLAILIIFAFIAFLKFKKKENTGENIKEIAVTRGPIETIISTTGTVLPKNRLEIKPPVAGRIESVLVKEGHKVKIGEPLAWMSSTERAALLDAARGQGEEKLKYWQEAYKPIALLSPIEGQVIVATTQPGQTVTTADAVVVLSDKLIVRAQVDETDIGKVKLGQKAQILLDAYPDTKIDALVEHIYYESQTVNNVTIYQVDLSPENVPDFFRSGMNSTINFIVNHKDDALLIPAEAVHRDREETYVLVPKEGKELKQPVVLGITDDKNFEVISGLNEKEKVIVKSKKFVLPQSESVSSPFTPFGQRKQAK